ncbi:MerR family transcriptional regulator [Ensifer sp.]|uniref:MerR family transcriptional regulator n=1 Tax=Ensifer sp. TaxID=1872086 RepID=UPI002E0E772B|nr:MerR family transcriptional regulator [Ensifer sp.]
MPRDHWKYEGVLASTDRVGFLPNLPLPHHDPATPLAIADMADAFGVTHRTLHFYEEKGLLTAARMGPMRVYGEEHIRRMAVINACREIDMPIAAILELLAGFAATEDQAEADRLFREALLARRRELAAQQANLRRQMQRITELLENGDPRDTAADDDQHVHLSPIESECLTFMADGYPASRIAGLMDMEVSAALTLEAGIIRKFSANNRFQAIAKAVLSGMISAD